MTAGMALARGHLLEFLRVRPPVLPLLVVALLTYTWVFRRESFAESFSPLCAALLACSFLSSDLGAGGLLAASRPFSYPSYTILRVLAAMALSLAPALLTAGSSVHPFPVELGAAAVSAWFLSAVAVGYCAWTRSGTAGMVLAGALWWVDLRVGFGANLWLSPTACAAHAAGHPLADDWIVNKAVLFAGGCSLWMVGSRRLVGAVQRGGVDGLPAIAAGVLAALALYLTSGFALGLAYIWRNRAEIRCATALRGQTAALTPLPAGRLLPPEARLLISEPPSPSTTSDPARTHLSLLETGLARHPNGAWSDVLALRLAELQGEKSPMQRVRYFLEVADRYPRSPIAPKALAAVLVPADENALWDDRVLRTARRLLRDYPSSPDVAVAAGVLELAVQVGPSEGVTPAEAGQAAEQAAQASGGSDRVRWLGKAAVHWEQAGDASRAVTVARRAVRQGRSLAARHALPWVSRAPAEENRTREGVRLAEGILPRLDR